MHAPFSERKNMVSVENFVISMLVKSLLLIRRAKS